VRRILTIQINERAGGVPQNVVSEFKLYHYKKKV
jgi:hypothetical protein